MLPHSKAILDKADSSGYTPLALACKGGHYDAALALVDAGARVASGSGATEVSHLHALIKGTADNDAVLRILADRQQLATDEALRVIDG